MNTTITAPAPARPLPSATAPTSKPARAPAPATTSVLVVDDHPIVRRGLVESLRLQPDLTLCGEAGLLAEARHYLLHHQPGAMILDLNLQAESGLALLQEFAARHQLPPTLVLSVHDEATHGPASLRAGARGYLMKSATLPEVLSALRTILDGGRALSPRLQQLLLDQATGTTTAKPAATPALSTREQEIYTYLGRGMTSKEIAERLGVSPRTIDAHKQNMVHKLGCGTSHALAYHAVLHFKASSHSGDHAPQP